MPSAIVGFTHLDAGFDNRRRVGLVQALLDRPSALVRPPTVCAGCDERESSSASPRPPIPAHPVRTAGGARIRSSCNLTCQTASLVAAPLLKAWRGLERTLDDYVMGQLVAA